MSGRVRNDGSIEIHVASTMAPMNDRERDALSKRIKRRREKGQSIYTRDHVVAPYKYDKGEWI